LSLATFIRKRRCRYCGAEIVDDDTGRWHELRCGRPRWLKS
jgi:hypothetical protein